MVYPDDSQDGSYDPRLEAYLNSLVNSMKHSRGGYSFSDAEIASRVARARREYLVMHNGMAASESDADSQETLELPGFPEEQWIPRSLHMTQSDLSAFGRQEF